MCRDLIANVKLRFILFAPTFNNSITKFAFVFILILVVCKVIENRYFDEQVTFFPTNRTSKFFSWLKPRWPTETMSFLRSKYLSFFNALYVVWKEFLGVENQIFLIAKLRRSVQLSRAHLRIIAPWQHYFERLRQRLAVVCNSVSEFTDPKFKLLQYLCSKDKRIFIT